VKQQCSAIAIGLIQEHEHFPAEDIMNATRVICSQLWVQPKVEHKILAQFFSFESTLLFWEAYWPKTIVYLAFVGWSIVGATIIFFQDYYACQLPCNFEASYGLQFMHKKLDHLVQQPTSFPLIIWMAKTNWIVYGHGYGQHRGWDMFFKYGVYEE